jgi:hypothetical protein
MNYPEAEQTPNFPQIEDEIMPRSTWFLAQRA